MANNDNTNSQNGSNTIKTLATPNYPPQYIANAVAEIEQYWRYRWLGLIGFLLCLLVIPAIIGIPLMFAGWTYRQMLLIRFWKTIPEDIARTKPEKVLFLQVPLFNIYWSFVVVYGLGLDLNKALERQRNSYRVNETLGLITCIFPVIPFLRFYYLRSCKKGAIALLEGTADNAA